MAVERFRVEPLDWKASGNARSLARAFQTAFKHSALGMDFTPAQAVSELRVWSDYALNGLGQVLVVRPEQGPDAGRIVGFAVGHVNDTPALHSPAVNHHLSRFRAYFVRDIALLPAYRGRGLSSQLTQQLEDHARSIGCDFITANVRGDNTPSLKHFSKNGYAEFYRSQHRSPTYQNVAVGKPLKPFSRLKRFANWWNRKKAQTVNTPTRES